MYKIQNFILWHYQYGSKYNTPFWDHAKSLPFKPDVEFKSMIDYVKNNSPYTCRNSDGEYSQWGHMSSKLWFDAMNSK